MTTVRSFAKGRRTARLVVAGDVVHVEHLAANGATVSVDEYPVADLPEVLAQLTAAGYVEISAYAADVVPGVRPLAGEELNAATEVTPAERAYIRAGLVPELRDLLDATPAGQG